MVPIVRSVGGRKLKLRREDACTCCGADLTAGTHAWWDKDTRTVTCTGRWGGVTSSPAPAPARPELGQPGASLLREHGRRRRRRENRTREAYPHVGGLLLALGGGPQHESAFEQGALAERAVADSLATHTNSDRVITLHNRRMPGGRGDIDHIAVAPTGVWVIDAKDWKGNVEINSPLFGTPRVFIRGRDCTRLIDGLERQIAAVRAALDRDGDHHIPLQGTLCFTKADLRFLRTQTFRGHLLLHRKALAKRLNAEGPLSPATVERVARKLATALPPAL